MLEEDEIISLPTLDMGNTGGSYTYVPAQGWQNGTYIKMNLYFRYISFRGIFYEAKSKPSELVQIDRWHL